MPQKRFMSVKEFRELGYLQELNRRFLHPLGLAIEVNVDPHGNETLGRVWDSRDDPEGIIFDESIANAPGFAEKAEFVYDEMAKRARERMRSLGFNEQPHKSYEPEPKQYQPVFSGIVDGSDREQQITVYKHRDREEDLFIEFDDDVLHALPPGTEVYTRFDMDTQRFHIQINSPVWSGTAIGDKWQLMEADSR